AGPERDDVRIEDRRPDALERPCAPDEIELHCVRCLFPVLDEVGEVVALEDIRGTEAIGPTPGDELATYLERPPLALDTEEVVVRVDARPLLLGEVLPQECGKVQNETVDRCPVELRDGRERVPAVDQLPARPREVGE